MAKRVHIKGAFEYENLVIGIASDQRIWKLCFEVNKALSINLVGNRFQAEMIPEEAPAPNAPESLFEDDTFPPPSRSLIYYEDTESQRGHEYILCEIEPIQLPKAAKAFRYFLLIRAVDTPAPNIDAILLQLHALESVRSAVDITHVKNIKSLLP